jgi:hypothetical protein
MTSSDTMIGWRLQSTLGVAINTTKNLDSHEWHVRLLQLTPKP